MTATRRTSGFGKGPALEPAEKPIEGSRSTPQALKRDHIFSGLAARVNSCPSLFRGKSEFLRNLL